MRDMAGQSLQRASPVLGRDAAVAEIVAMTRPRLLAAANRIGAVQDSEDAVQEAYLSLLRRLERPGDFRILPWLLTAVVRISYRQKAVAQRQFLVAKRLAALVEPLASDDHATADGVEEQQRVQELVADLPPKLRDVFVLRHFAGLSTRHVADLLRLRPSTITTRLQRGRRRLQRQILGRSRRLAFAGPLVAGPWPSMARASATGLLGGAVKAKMACVLVAGCLLSAVGGFVVGTRVGASASAASSLGPFEHEMIVGTARRADLDAAHGGGPRSQMLALPEAPSAAAQPGGRVLPREAKTHGSALEELARTWGVSDEALELVRRADKAYFDYGMGGDPRLLAALRDRGQEGFRALMATAIHGRTTSSFSTLLKAVSASVEPDLVLASLKDGVPNGHRRGLLVDVLGHAATPRELAWVADRIGEEQHPVAFLKMAKLLAASADARLPAVCESRLFPLTRQRELEWQRVRGGLIASLGRVGGDDARRVLIRLLRDERTTTTKTLDVSLGLRSLWVVDPAAAASEIQTLDDQGRLPERLAPALRRQLDAYERTGRSPDSAWARGAER